MNVGMIYSLFVPREVYRLSHTTSSYEKNYAPFHVNYRTFLPQMTKLAYIEARGCVNIYIYIGAAKYLCVPLPTAKLIVCVQVVGQLILPILIPVPASAEPKTAS
jgi:hypothetical protein